ncbi:MAG: ATP-binding protein [Bacteroidales bacterium]|nr:ATP-binding protein [Bacteroidales bacterium]
MKFNPVIKYPGIILSGVVFGIFILLPLSEFASYIEYIERGTARGPVTFLLGKLLDTLLLRTPIRFIYYSGFGILSVALFVHFYTRFKERRAEINQLLSELNQGLLPLIAQGESNILEFKSSYRYDLKQKTVNKALEAVVMKTLAGFMNSGGGTLLLGVSDDGTILGLENDYQTLKRKDKDGFEQLLMSSVSEKLGTAACKYIRLVFHSHNQMEVCRIIVERAGFPIYVKEGNSKKFYLRTGSGTRDMDIQEAINYISENWKK